MLVLEEGAAPFSAVLADSVASAWTASKTRSGRTRPLTAQHFLKDVASLSWLLRKPLGPDASS